MLESGQEGPSLGSELLTLLTRGFAGLCSEPHALCRLGLRCALPSWPALGGARVPPTGVSLQAAIGPNPLLCLEPPRCVRSRPLCLVFRSPPVMSESPHKPAPGRVP